MKLPTVSPRTRLLVKVFIGLSIIAFLLIRFNPAEILDAISRVRIGMLILPVSLYAVTLLVLSLRWRFILSRMGHRIPVSVAYQGFVAGILISDLTPARVGEVSRPLTIRDRVPVPVGLGSVFLDRYCDFIAIFLLGCGGVLLISATFSPELVAGMLIILSVPILILSGFWFRRRLVLSLLHRIPVPALAQFADHLGRALDSLDRPGITMGGAILTTLGVWVLQSLRVVLIAAAAGYSLPLQELILVQPLISALALIPISLSGLGFVEGGYVTLFSRYGIPVAAGLAIALLDRLLTVGFHLLVGIRYALRVVGR